MEDLSNYLNDHLAGWASTMELLDGLIAIYRGKPLEGFFSDLRRDINADHEILRSLIARLGPKESVVRKTGAWVTEELSRAKIRPAEAGEEKVGLLLALEGLALGLKGKGAFWRAVGAASTAVPQLRPLDYAGWEERAAQQHYRVEAKRVEIERAS